MKRGAFDSKLGVILASAGSAVGLGNIWRFPTEVGSNGGAAFILIYLACIFLVAMPVMVAEFVIGRSAHANTVEAYRKLAPGKPWFLTGYLGVAAGFMVLSFYSVVAGWTLGYTLKAITNYSHASADYAALFNGFVSTPLQPVIFLSIFMFITHWVVSRGVEKGIERFSKTMMPLLFIIIAILAVCSLSMPGARKGLEFLFRPDFSKLNMDVALSAMGQAFFSLSVGIGTLVTYSSYFSKGTKLISSATNVCLIDTLVAICAGLFIFPAVFSMEGVEAGAGPGLVFITLPHVFDTLLGGIPWLRYFVSVLFDLLLLLAALTSSISMHEICTAYIHETYNTSRRRAATIVTTVCGLLGIACSLSFGIWSCYTICGMTFFELFDYLTAKILMPLGGMLICVFAGWIMDRKLLHDQLTNNGTLKVHSLRALIFLTRWIAPLGVGMIFVNELLK